MEVVQPKKKVTTSKIPVQHMFSYIMRERFSKYKSEPDFIIITLQGRTSGYGIL